MATRSVITIFMHVPTGNLVDVNGDVIGRDEFPRIHYKENVNVNLTLYATVDDSSGPTVQVVDVDPADDLTATVDSDFVRAESSGVGPMIETLTGGINQTGDFAGGNADPLLGQFSIRLDANTPAYANRIANDTEKKNTFLELVVQGDSATGVTEVFQLPFRTFNLGSDV